MTSLKDAELKVWKSTNMSDEWYNPDATKKQLTCIMNGCKICESKLYCKEHDKPCKGNIPSLPPHCSFCGEYIYDPSRDTKGMFS
jgi:hypothetical protein